MNKVALVTGASSGIGKALVLYLLDQGYEVIGIARSKDALSSLKESVVAKPFSYFVCDVSEQDQVSNVLDQLQAQGKYPEIFFLNAGLAGAAAMETSGLHVSFHHKVFSINYYGVLHFIEKWLSLKNSSIDTTFVITNSINAIFAPPGGSAYSASKAAIAQACDSLRLTYRDQPVSFISVFCGPVATPGLAGKLPFTWNSEKMAQYLLKKSRKKPRHLYPSKFYFLFCKCLSWLPDSWVMKILAGLSKAQS